MYHLYRRMLAEPYPAHADATLIRAALREELAPLLVRRMRAGIWLLVAALAVFAIEALMIYRAESAALFEVKLVQLATLLEIVESALEIGRAEAERHEPRRERPAR